MDILPSMEGVFQTQLYDAIFRNFAGHSLRVDCSSLTHSQRNIKKFITHKNTIFGTEKNVPLES